jgi:hypothetical protein
MSTFETNTLESGICRRALLTQRGGAKWPLIILTARNAAVLVKSSKSARAVMATVVLCSGRLTARFVTTKTMSARYTASTGSRFTHTESLEYK